MNLKKGKERKKEMINEWEFTDLLEAFANRLGVSARVYFPLQHLLSILELEFCTKSE